MDVALKIIFVTFNGNTGVFNIVQVQRVPHKEQDFAQSNVANSTPAGKIKLRVSEITLEQRPGTFL